MRYTLGRVSDYPWADYGAILTHGMSHRGADGIVNLERCGPYVPPISLPAIVGVIVDQATRIAIESSPLNGFVFKPVRKLLIVHLEWRSWNLGADEPRMHPPGGEPANYIVGQQHCETTSRRMGSLWELAGTPYGRVSRSDGESSWTSDQEPDLDFITPNDETWDVVSISESAKSFIENMPAVSVGFHPHTKLEITT